MPKVVREGDKNNAGGKVLKGNSNFIVDGKPVSVDGSPVSAHRPFKKPHKPNGAPKTANGTNRFLVDGIPVNVIGFEMVPPDVSKSNIKNMIKDANLTMLKNKQKIVNYCKLTVSNKSKS